jgi:hypothetical protein
MLTTTFYYLERYAFVWMVALCIACGVGAGFMANAAKNAGNEVDAIAKSIDHTGYEAARKKHANYIFLAAFLSILTILLFVWSIVSLVGFYKHK